MKRRPRRDPELARLDALGVEGRRAELHRLVAELHDARDASQPRPPDVEAVVHRVLDQRERARADAALAAAYDRGRAPDRQPCCRCGIEAAEYVEANGRTTTPAWHQDDGSRYHCGRCHQDLSFDTPGVVEADRKVQVARRLLGLDALPLVAVAAPHLFAGLLVWHHERPDVPPARHPDERWHFVDVERLRGDWQAIVDGAWHGPIAGDPPPPPVSDACPACGCAPQRHYRTARGIATCGGCGWQRQQLDGSVLRDNRLPSPTPSRPGERTPRDVDAAALLGLPLNLPAYGPDPLAGLAEHVKFRYWAETGRQQPNERPWAHLDVERMRKRATVPA